MSDDLTNRDDDHAAAEDDSAANDPRTALRDALDALEGNHDAEFEVHDNGDHLVVESDERLRKKSETLGGGEYTFTHLGGALDGVLCGVSIETDGGIRHERAGDGRTKDGKSHTKIIVHIESDDTEDDDPATDDRAYGVDEARELAAELIDERTDVERRNTWGGETEIESVDPADPSKVAMEIANRTVGAEHVVELERQGEATIELDVIVFDSDDRKLVVRSTTTRVREPAEEGTETDDEQYELPDLAEPPRYDIERDGDLEGFACGDELIADGGDGNGGGLGAELRAPDGADDTDD